MSLKSGTVSLVRRAVGLLKPTLGSTPVSNLPQRCLLSTTNAARPMYNNLSFGLSSRLLGVDSFTSTFHHPLPAILQTVCVEQSRDYHSVLRPRLHCKGCYFVWRHGRKYVECSDTPSHKQMKKVLTRKLWKEDYTKGNVRKAMMWNRDLARISDRMCDRDSLSHNWMASRIGKDV